MWISTVRLEVQRMQVWPAISAIQVVPMVLKPAVCDTCDRGPPPACGEAANSSSQQQHRQKNQQQVEGAASPGSPGCHPRQQVCCHTLSGCLVQR
jgi:hypothetical protein